MTTYAHDPAASTLVAVWPTGDGAVAHKVARVPPSFDPALARYAAGALTTLSARLWLAYTDAEVEEIPFDELAEAAHQVGRIVSRARGRVFREAVARDVTAETAAIRAADRGDLSGRAQQGVAHTRPQPRRRDPGLLPGLPRRDLDPGAAGHGPDAHRSARRGGGPGPVLP